ncbi:MAG TPA: formate/nitrite transporter family protein [Candidatus Acidoferrales bacterium]|nr:formate/nitrite transporter family protein [Candidatus Acidoferrales bacterium]
MAEGDNELALSEPEQQQAQERSSINARVVHEAVRREGEDELRRTSSALAWSGLAAGLSMGFSLMIEGVLRAALPDAPWVPLISKLGYSAGFVIVILGRQQLFTENTLTPILPLLHSRDPKMAVNVARLWSIVLATNLAGALLIALVLARTGVFPPNVRIAFLDIGRDSMSETFGTVLLRGIFAGWLLALLVWLLPFAEHARFFVIIALTWMIGVCGFSHIVAGAVEVFYLACGGAASWQQALGGYIVPALIGNIVGGVALVAALNHAQVVS